MNDKHLDDALKDLQAELSVTPSPEFAAKVRARIEHAPTKPAWNVWAWGGVAATCAVAVIAVVLGVGRAFRPGAPGGAEAPASTEANTSAGAKAPAYTEGTASSDVGRPFRAGRSPAPVVAAAAPRAEPEVLVPPDQLIAIRRLMASVRAGARPNLPASPTLFDPDTGELIPLKPIEIPLIVVDPLPGGPDGRSGGSERK